MTFLALTLLFLLVGTVWFLLGGRHDVVVHSNRDSAKRAQPHQPGCLYQGWSQLTMGTDQSIYCGGCGARYDRPPL
jgi:hypothetical protein